jgi:hypothetical protein
MQGLLRKAEARTRQALVEAMNAAVSAVTDARGFFRQEWYRGTETPLPDRVFEIADGAA